MEGSPNSSVYLSPNFLFEKGFVEGSPNFFPNSVSFGVFSHSKGVLCSKWLSPPKRFFGVFPKQFFTFVSRSLAFFFGQMAVASEKVQWRVPPTILYICLPSCFIKALWRVPPTVLYIDLPVSSWGQSCMNCSHVSHIQIQSEENNPSCCWLLGYSLGLFSFSDL